MAYIRVDHRQLEKAASTIDSYIVKHKKKMQTIDQSIDSLNAQWQGSDYAQLQNEWRQMNASDSTSARMIKTLDNYADFVRFSANKYKSAQANAINTAGRLPRY